jgi:ABC-type dipeptide/oligopeptide/nickel transport system permease subunit
MSPHLPNASWGLLAAEGASSITALRTAWWLILFPGLALGLTLFSLNSWAMGSGTLWTPGSRTGGERP